MHFLGARSLLTCKVFQLDASPQPLLLSCWKFCLRDRQHFLWVIPVDQAHSSFHLPLSFYNFLKCKSGHVTFLPINLCSLLPIAGVSGEDHT